MEVFIIENASFNAAFIKSLQMAILAVKYVAYVVSPVCSLHSPYRAYNRHVEKTVDCSSAMGAVYNALEHIIRANLVSMLICPHTF